MTITLNQVFPSQAAWNAPYHLGNLDSLLVKFSPNERASRFSGLAKIDAELDSLPEAMSTWEGWEQVTMQCQRSYETDRNTFGFRQQDSGDHIFVYRHYDLRDAVNAQGVKEKRLVELTDVYYVSAKSQTAIKKFITGPSTVYSLSR